jgi:hypothetical protein
MQCSTFHFSNTCISGLSDPLTYHHDAGNASTLKESDIITPRRIIQPVQKVLRLRRNRLQPINQRHIEESIRNRAHQRIPTIYARHRGLEIQHLVQHHRKHLVQLAAQLVIPVARQHNPLQTRRQHGQVANHIRARNRAGQRRAFDRTPTQLKRQDAGGGEAVEENDGWEVTAGFVDAVDGFGGDERCGEKFERDFEERGERLRCQAVQHALDLKVHMQVLEIGGDEADGYARAETRPGAFLRVHVVAHVRGEGFP